MFVLTALPETIPVPLDDAGLPGVVAHVRPLDDMDLARWLDMFPPGSGQQYVATVYIAKKQLVRVDGISLRATERAEPTAFDPANDVHMRTLFIQRETKSVAALIVDAVWTRANLTEAQAKKSVSPSDSHRAPNGATSPAAAAMTPGETPTTADSPRAAASPTRPSTRSTSGTAISTRRAGARGPTSPASPSSADSSGVTTS